MDSEKKGFWVEFIKHGFSPKKIWYKLFSHIRIVVYYILNDGIAMHLYKNTINPKENRYITNLLYAMARTYGL